MPPTVAAISSRLISNRLLLEIVAAGALTLFTLVWVARPIAVQSDVVPKVNLQAPSIPQFNVRTDETNATSEFIEAFALSRVAPMLPESSLEAPPVVAMAALSAARLQPFRDPRKAREKVRQTVPKAQFTKPPSRQTTPLATTHEEATQSETVAPVRKRIPVLSTITDFLPKPAEVVSNIGKLGRKIGSIFARS